MTRTGYAPYGVIFQSPDKAIVGVNHGHKVELSKDLYDKISLMCRANGAWYEGDGGDKSVFPTPYKGSWDTKFMKSVKGYPVEFLFVLFSNVKENKTAARITDSSKTIFESILKSDVNYFNDRKVEDATLTEFLKAMDMLEEAKRPATETNVNKFLNEGERRMWPSQGKPHKFAQQAEKWRNRFVLAQPEGVYFAGAGHLPEMLDLYPSLKMIGGEKAR